jgi:hypothetical protein
MAADKPQPTLADYVAIAICPALIMALVGSLVFFLLEVLYVGKYEARLQWILFCFVFAAVLIARISMIPGIAERAPLYGVILGGLVWFALWKFVVYPPDSPLAEAAWAVNLGLMGIIWWSAHQLTWDCTLIDETVDASGQGLLEVAGLEKGAPSSEAADQAEAAELEEDAHADTGTTGLLGWWDRYRRYQEKQRRKPHAPGVWIVYFSLAALPLFGLGQSLIPAGDLARRRYVFWLMGIYVASGLGLLLTTSFLGLRRYLRQRNLQMPVSMTGIWLAMGGAMIAVLLLLGAFLPRPNAEYPLVRLGAADSPDQQASRWAVFKDSPGRGEGRPGSQGAPDGQGGSTRSGQGGNQSGGQNPNGSGSGQGQNQGGSSSHSSQGNSGSGQGQNQSGNSQGESGRGRSGGNSQSGGQSSSSGQEKGGNQSSGQNSKGGSDQAAKVKPPEHRDGQDQNPNHTGQSSSSESPWSSLQSLFTGLMKLLKWLVFAILALVLAFVVVRAVLKFMANFTGWAKRLLAALEKLWQGLFGWWGQKAAEEVEEEEAAPLRRPRPFASFSNPFADGSAGQRSPDELVRYSFEALEAWAWEHGLGRQSDDTPLEFAERVALDTPGLENSGRRLAALYARVAYARGRLPDSCRGVLRQFWRDIETIVQTPLPV